MIRVQGLTVRLPGFVLNAADLNIGAGEFFTIIGPTGSGKTLILESIAGLQSLTAGSIEIGGRDVTGLPPERRGIGIVYQDLALFPHLNVENNIRYGLRYRPAGPADREGLERLVDSLNLRPLLHRPVTHLSGGEKQRVALARALAVSPSVLLLDEPLSALDPNFREEIRAHLKKLHRDTGVTVLMVTHDFSEAHTLADRTAVILNGRIAQVGGVKEVFTRPATAEVARFVGMKNIFEAGICGKTADLGDITLALGGSGNGKDRFVAVRPEDIRLYRENPDSREVNVLAGEIVAIQSLGIFCEVSVRCGRTRWYALEQVRSWMETSLGEGDTVWLQIPPERIHLL